MKNEILALLNQENYTGMTTSEIAVELTDNSSESFKKVILGSLKNIEATHNTFFRCNRTTLVNISNIRVVDKLNKKLILNNGVYIIVWNGYNKNN